MHDCKRTKEQITELLLDGVDRKPSDVLSKELRACADCCAEFDELNATLRLTTRLRDAAAPAESYWTGYHTRLRQKLMTVNAPQVYTNNLPERSWLMRFFKSSVAVPVPVAVALIIASLVLVPLGIRSAQRQTIPNPSIVRVPVEVPVVQKEIVTRVVYRERRSRARASKQANDAAKVEGTFAKSQKPRSTEIPASLVGFKPTEEIKLTVIKGGSANEK